jgi:spermidine/putrescine-binding protein
MQIGNSLKLLSSKNNSAYTFINTSTANYNQSINAEYAVYAPNNKLFELSVSGSITWVHQNFFRALLCKNILHFMCKREIRRIKSRNIFPGNDIICQREE